MTAAAAEAQRETRAAKQAAAQLEGERALAARDAATAVEDAGRRLQAASEEVSPTLSAATASACRHQL